MKLDLVQIQGFRNLDSTTLYPSDTINFIFGENGSGKSSLLEAIHFLGFGRSFRTSKQKNVIQRSQSSFTVFSVVKAQDGKKTKLGISRTIDDKLTISVDGVRSSKMSELVSHIPVQIFTPQSAETVLGSPTLRRRFVDWGLFHVEHSFSLAYSAFRKLLKHNNALLRTQQASGKFDPQADYWLNEFCRSSESLTSHRLELVDRLKSIANAVLEEFLPEFSFKISYYRGWERDTELLTVLRNRWDRDVKNGFLGAGPHKADFKIRINNVDASEVLSRGQQRMLVAALQLSQAMLLNETMGKHCIFLLDDIGAELDAEKREKFLDKLLMTNAQIFVTAIEQNQISFIEKYQNKKMFHVKHGSVNEENTINV